MNTRHSDRLLLCLCWIIYLGMILTSGALSSFIATWQHTLILVAAVTFVVLAAVSWWAHDGTTHEHHQHSTRSPADQVIQTLVHCLPLFLIAALGATALGGQAFSTSGFRAPPSGPGPGPGIAPATAAPLAHAAPPGEFTIADVYSGHPVSTSEVTVIGMAYAPSDEDYARLPGGLTKDVVPLLLYRYQIICCAADATPLYIGVLGVDRTRFTNDSWVRITGTLTPPAPPANVGILHATSSEAISEPAEPYLKRSL